MDWFISHSLTIALTHRFRAVASGRQVALLETEYERGNGGRNSNHYALGRMVALCIFPRSRSRSAHSAGIVICTVSCGRGFCPSFAHCPGFLCSLRLTMAFFLPLFLYMCTFRPVFCLFCSPVWRAFLSSCSGGAFLSSCSGGAFLSSCSGGGEKTQLKSEFIKVHPLSLSLSLSALLACPSLHLSLLS
jgi:hypothetical protein